MSGLVDIGDISNQKRVIIVLPEVFGVNGWVRSIADRLAAAGVPALAMPLFARTAPGLDLSYSDQDLAEARCHREAMNDCRSDQSTQQHQPPLYV